MKILIADPTIGADIEVFLQDRGTQEIVSAEGLIPGTKHQPFNFDEANKYFAISLDNVLAEFCIPPAKTTEDWLRSIQHSLAYIDKTIPEHLCSVGIPAAVLHEKYLQTANAKLFGCEPDFCVWTRGENPKPEAADKNLRSAGGHIHIGYDRSQYDYDAVMFHNEAIIKAMDLFVGVPSVIQEPDNKRKELYGRAGCFRFKEAYGVEYRTVSNYYLQSEDLIKWAFDSTRRAIDFLNEYGVNDINKFSEDIQASINTANKPLAKQLVREFQLQLAI